MAFHLLILYLLPMLSLGRHIACWFRVLLVVMMVWAAFGSVSAACPFMVAEKISEAADADRASCCTDTSKRATHAPAKDDCCNGDRAIRCCCYPSFVVAKPAPVMVSAPYESLPAMLLDDPVNSLPSDPPFVPPRS